MKKIAFMFAAAAMFVACGSGEQKPAAEVVEPVEVVEEAVEAVLTAEDSAAVAAMFEGKEVTDSVLQAAYDSILAAKNVVEEVVEAAADAAEAATEE